MLAAGKQQLVVAQPSSEADQDGGTDCTSCPADYLPTSRGSGVQRSVCCASTLRAHRGNLANKIGEVCSFFRWRAALGLLNGCFGPPDWTSGVL